MHREAKEFTEWVRRCFPEFFTAKVVLDVGAGDINGNNRFLFTNCTYHANDVCEAPNVTIVSRTKDLTLSGLDVVISTECFEHDPEYARSWVKMYEMLKPGGLFCFTCASTGRPEHGTRRTSPRDSFGTRSKQVDMQDYYKNLTVQDLNSVLKLNEKFEAWDSYYERGHKDLFFIGIKRSNPASSALRALPRYPLPSAQRTTGVVGQK